MCLAPGTITANMAEDEVRRGREFGFVYLGSICL